MMNADLLAELSHTSVLYVEDEPGLRRNVGEMLGLLFGEVYLAENGIQALSLFQAQRPDLVITDLQMPQMGGMELVRTLRERGNETPIIILSAYTDTTDMLEAIELSLVRYIVKPITETKLADALEKFMLGRRKKETIRLQEGWGIDFINHHILSPDGVLVLTKKESALLKLLLTKKSLVTYEEIEARVWEGEYMSLNALRLLVKNLRKKLPKEMVKNIQGVGYTL
jgi:DNA-binding response OmpR family regulator